MVIRPKDLMKILTSYKKSYCYKLARQIKDSTGKMFVTDTDLKNYTKLTDEDIRRALRKGD
jgi:hypothetical protein